MTVFFQILTNTAEAENEVSLSDSGQLAWSRYTCWPTYNCVEVFSYNSGVLEQFSDGTLGQTNRSPRLDNDGNVVWWWVDQNFGATTWVSRIMRFSNGEVSQLSDGERQLSTPRMSNSGRVIWSDQSYYPHGAIFEWTTDRSTALRIPYGLAAGINSSDQILFSIWTDEWVSWLYRNGAYYQPFGGEPYVYPLDINDRGDVTGYGGIQSVAQDVILMLVDPMLGDFDEDGDSDLVDAFGFTGCLSGEGAAHPAEACNPLDFDADGDGDLRDAAGFQNSFTGDCALGITTPPNGDDVCFGDPFTLSIDARGPVAEYQWRKNESDLPGATNSAYTISTAFPSHTGYYGVRLTSACGWETQSDKRYYLQVYSAPPSVVLQPQSRVVCGGEDVQFCCYPDSWNFTGFQWQRNGVDLPGADWACLVLRDVVPADAGQYRCRLSNACGSVYSGAAALSLAPPGLPMITSQPGSQTVSVGQPAQLIVAAACSGTFQWRLDGQPIPGAELPLLLIFPADCDDEGSYTVEVCNDFGCVVSAPAFLNVTPCP